MLRTDRSLVRRWSSKCKLDRCRILLLFYWRDSLFRNPRFKIVKSIKQLLTLIFRVEFMYSQRGERVYRISVLYKLKRYSNCLKLYSPYIDDTFE